MVELIEISLLPKEYHVGEGVKLNRNVILAVVGSAAVVVATLMMFLFFNQKLHSTKAELVKVEKEIISKKPIQDRILQLEETQLQLTAKRDGLKTIDVARDKWVKLLEVYAKHLPQNTWITELLEDGAGANPKITVKGTSTVFGEVPQLLARMESDTLLSAVTLLNIKEAKAGGEMVSFEITNLIPWVTLTPPVAPAADAEQPAARRR